MTDAGERLYGSNWMKSSKGSAFDHTSSSIFPSIVGASFVREAFKDLNFNVSAFTSEAYVYVREARKMYVLIVYLSLMFIF